MRSRIRDLDPYRASHPYSFRGLVAVALSITFAVNHTNGTSGPSDVSPGNALPQSNVLIIDNCYEEGRFEPATIQLACGNGTAVANNLTWSKWTSTMAAGQGTVNEVKLCPKLG